MAMKPTFNPSHLMEKAVEVMKASVREQRADDTIPPKVGAVLWKPDGTVETACRGELREGDHAEYTLLERNFPRSFAGCIGARGLQQITPQCIPQLCGIAGRAPIVDGARLSRHFSRQNGEKDERRSFILRHSAVVTAMFRDSRTTVVRTGPPVIFHATVAENSRWQTTDGNTTTTSSRP